MMSGKLQAETFSWHAAAVRHLQMLSMAMNFKGAGGSMQRPAMPSLGLKSGSCSSSLLSHLTDEVWQLFVCFRRECAFQILLCLGSHTISFLNRDTYLSTTL